jgi:hypothetical protein
MTEAEEIRYLSDLLLQASRWERSEGEVLSGLELEVQDRMRRLTGVETVDENGMCQSVVERGLAKAAEKKKYKNKTKEGRHRIFIQGRRLTVDLDKLVKVPFKSSPTGYKYELAPGVTEEQLLQEAIDNAKK